MADALRMLNQLASLNAGGAARPAFRADTDQSGEWYVWTRLATIGAATGWATMQRCESRELAQRLADDLNQRALRVAI